MADERTKKPFDRKSPVPQGYDWPSLLKKDGDELFDHYRHVLSKKTEKMDTMLQRVQPLGMSFPI